MLKAQEFIQSLRMGGSKEERKEQKAGEGVWRDREGRKENSELGLRTSAR